MRYLLRKIFSALSMIGIGAIVAHGIMNQFTEQHFLLIGACVAILLLMAIGKFIRKIIFFPFNLLRKALFKF